MNLLKLFLLMVLLGGAGTAIGAAAGQSIGPGGLLIGGFAGGGALVVVAGFLGCRWEWIARPQRLWAILGAAFGFALGCMVFLATLAAPTPAGPLAAALLVGAGGVMGAVVARSPHGKT